VTGAAGLLGGAVARQLHAGGAKVIGLDVAWAQARAVIDADGVNRADGDVRDTDLLRGLLVEHRIDTAIHLAAQTLVGSALREPADTFSNNIEGSWSLLEACRAISGVTSIVVASSDKAYGDWAGKPYSEAMALRARHPYDVSKAATDLLAQSYAATYGLPVAITRCGNLYGGGDLNWSRIVPGTIRSVLEGMPPTIRSDGTYVRDYLHVDDAAAGVLTLAEAVRQRAEVRGEAFNFASRDRLTVLQIVERILTLMRSSLEPNVLGLPLTEIPEQRVSTAKARRILGWRPRVSLDTGLRDTIEWYRTHLAAVV
jgi:CDP-glucose 4,6-dehydratase